VWGLSPAIADRREPQMLRCSLFARTEARPGEDAVRRDAGLKARDRLTSSRVVWWRQPLDPLTVSSRNNSTAGSRREFLL
jgi:hypothetical protein